MISGISGTSQRPSRLSKTFKNASFEGGEGNPGPITFYWVLVSELGKILGEVGIGAGPFWARLGPWRDNIGDKGFGGVRQRPPRATIYTI